MAGRQRMAPETLDWLRSQRQYLSRELAQSIEASRLSALEVAELLDIHRTGVSCLLNGAGAERYSVDRLVDCLMRIGRTVVLTVEEEAQVGKGKHELGKQQERIRELLKTQDMTVAMLAERLFMSRESVEEHCIQLREQGILRIQGARMSLVDYKAIKDPNPFPRPSAVALEAGQKRGLYG